ncbi:cell division protein FtsN [Erwinia toletana]|uniref:Cell division protein FtsN n=1 Tax=Winslowiella toletana TaxID=92490 RepID=A0ABS4P947_9GAMM|nr:cell division protein FtsN [Winslowiella toletana]MBP2169156.1 cell division protein FtsN [Winslowiella toletana]
MAQKDYVGRGRSTGTRRKKPTGRSKKRSSGSGVSKFMVVLAVAVLIAFIGVLWFLAHHKKDDTPVIPNHKAAGNGLPPKPEERWRYIKELENRQIGVPSPTEPSAGGEVHSQTQLTDEQRQLLEQMQADMRQQPTQLNEVPWNEQTPAQRQQTIQHQQQQQQVQQQQQRMLQQNQLQQQSRMPQQQTQPAAPITREPARQAPPAQASKPQETVKAKEKEEKPKAQSWMVQCGSFKGTDQAESVRAALAFEGFESRITTGGGWNRVVVGPYNNRASADSTLKRLRSSGHSNCIPLAIGG